MATFKFLGSGIRAGKKVAELRSDLADTVAEHTKLSHKANSQHNLQIQNIKIGRKHIQELVRANPALVREVGKALLEIENEYLRHLKLLRSEQAKEVLRLATEKHINDILEAYKLPPTGVKPFIIKDTN